MLDFEKEIQRVQKEITDKKQEVKDLEKYLKSLANAAKQKKKIGASESAPKTSWVVESPQKDEGQK